jgi:hypothetical protein
MHKDDKRFVEEVYLAVVNRLPTPRELEIGLKAITEGEGDHAAQIADYLPKKKAFDDYEKVVDARQPAWEKGLAAAPVWEAMPVTKAVSQGKARLNVNAGDYTVLASGPNPDKDTYTVTFTSKLTNITGLRLEVLPDNSLPAKGPGRAGNGNFVLHEFQVKAAPATRPADAKPVALHKAIAAFSQEGFPIANAIDGNAGTGWAVMPRFGQPTGALFETKEPIKIEGGAVITITFSMQHGEKHTIGKFRVSATSDKEPKLADGVAENVRKLLSIAPDKRTDAQKAELRNLHRGRDGEYMRLAATVAVPPPVDKRVTGAQDLAWALINTPDFLFNH